MSRRREANLQKGRQLLREGKLSEARDCFTRCVNITPAMAHNLIKVRTLSDLSDRFKLYECLVALVRHLNFSSYNEFNLFLYSYSYSYSHILIELEKGNRASQYLSQ